MTSLSGSSYPPAIHIEHTGSFTLPLPRELTFSLFSPEGERTWVPGWDPHYLHPARASINPGTVFRTGHGGEETFWLVLRCDESLAEVEYARVTPGSRMGTVSVRCEEENQLGATRVTVTYALTALSQSGNMILALVTPEAYALMLEEWRSQIIASRPAATIGPAAP